MSKLWMPEVRSFSETTANTRPFTALTPTEYRASWLEATEKAIESVPGTQTGMPKMDKRRHSSLRWNQHSCRLRSRHTWSFTLHRCRKTLRPCGTKLQKLETASPWQLKLSRPVPSWTEKNKRISDLEEVQRSFEEKFTEPRSEATKAKATLQKLEEGLAQELSGPKASMDVDLGATTPLPPVHN